MMDQKLPMEMVDQETERATVRREDDVVTAPVAAPSNACSALRHYSSSSRERFDRRFC